MEVIHSYRVQFSNQLSNTGKAKSVMYVLHPAVEGQTWRHPEGDTMFVYLPWNYIAIIPVLESWLASSPYAQLYYTEYLKHTQ